MPLQPYTYRLWPDAPQGMHEWLRTVRQSAFGTVTLDADASTTVTDINCSAASFIAITPTNAAAATLQAGASHLYVTPAAGSFTLNTADAGSAAGTETFAWAILS